MSQSELLGVADAGRWSGVAADMAYFLERWLKPESPPPTPLGTIAGAERFFRRVLEGAALDRHERASTEISVMAGLSNWTIALNVLTRLPEHHPPLKPEKLTQVSQRYLDALSKIRESQRTEELETTVKEMRAFFVELLRQGARRRQSTYAAEESPRG